MCGASACWTSQITFCSTGPLEVHVAQVVAPLGKSDPLVQHNCLSQGHAHRHGSIDLAGCLHARMIARHSSSRA
jgi:hypothetical protein